MECKTIAEAIEQNRVVIIQMDPKFIVQVLNWWSNPTYMICLPVTDELPEDSIVTAVCMSFERGSLQVKVASKSFQPVDRGVIPPEVPGSYCKWECKPFPNIDEKLRGLLVVKDEALKAAARAISKLLLVKGESDCEELNVIHNALSDKV